MTPGGVLTSPIRPPIRPGRRHSERPGVGNQLPHVLVCVREQPIDPFRHEGDASTARTDHRRVFMIANTT